MAWDPRIKLWLDDGRLMLKNVNLQFQSQDRELVQRVRQEGLLLPRSTHWFLQGDQPEWIMFEFWTANQALVLNECLAFAERLGIELEMD